MNLAAQGATQTIVVVEGDVLVRLAISGYLRDCGYQVIETNNADEALAVLRSNVAVDLVFSSMQLPGSMDGSGLARWVREHQPATMVVLSSGIAKSAEAARDLCEDGAVLQKPYHHEQVVQRIRTLLASRTS